MSFIGAAEHLEEGFACGLAEGDATELVEDDEMVSGKSFEEPFEWPVVAGFEELGDERGNRMEPDMFSLGAGLAPASRLGP